MPADSVTMTISRRIASSRSTIGTPSRQIPTTPRTSPPTLSGRNSRSNVGDANAPVPAPASLAGPMAACACPAQGQPELVGRRERRRRSSQARSRRRSSHRRGEAPPAGSRPLGATWRAAPRAARSRSRPGTCRREVVRRDVGVDERADRRRVASDQPGQCRGREMGPARTDWAVAAAPTIARKAP